jgi:hypothetical protein
MREVEKAESSLTYSVSRSLDSLDGIGSLVSITIGPVYPQSGHRYIAPVYPPIQRIIFSEWHFGQNRFVTVGLTKKLRPQYVLRTASYLDEGKDGVWVAAVSI